MKEVFDVSLKTSINLCLVLTLVFCFGLGCGFNNPFRDYSSKPFNSQEWLAGDSIERGRMMRDLSKSHILNGKSKEEVLKLLGEPDKKSEDGNKEIWQYQVKFAGENPSNYFPVSFKDNKAATR